MAASSRKHVNTSCYESQRFWDFVYVRKYERVNDKGLLTNYGFLLQSETSLDLINYRFERQVKKIISGEFL